MVCSEPECTLPGIVKGLCRAHYAKKAYWAQKNEVANGEHCYLCKRKVKARGLCSSHYSNWRQQTPYRRTVVQWVIQQKLSLNKKCSECRKSFKAKRKHQKFCSKTCKQADYAKKHVIRYRETNAHFSMYFSKIEKELLRHKAKMSRISMNELVYRTLKTSGIFD